MGAEAVTARALAWSPGAPDREREEDWRDWASCAEVGWEAFFPGAYQRFEAARRVCEGCPVAEECLADALETGDFHGIRGGLTGDERRELGVPVTRPFPVLCTSGRHFADRPLAGCSRCEAEAAPQRRPVLDRAAKDARNAALRKHRAAKRAKKRPAVRTKGIAA
jgi:WhiB family redox-sensing transcriptional regulator